MKCSSSGRTPTATSERSCWFARDAYSSASTASAESSHVLTRYHCHPSDARTSDTVRLPRPSSQCSRGSYGHAGCELCLSCSGRLHSLRIATSKLPIWQSSQRYSMRLSPGNTAVLPMACWHCCWSYTAAGCRPVAASEPSRFSSGRR